MPTLDETMEVLNVNSPPRYTEDELEIADRDVKVLLSFPLTFPMYA